MWSHCFTQLDFSTGRATVAERRGTKAATPAVDPPPPHRSRPKQVATVRPEKKQVQQETAASRDQGSDKEGTSSDSNKEAFEELQV